MRPNSNSKPRLLVLACLFGLSSACVFQELAELPGYQSVDQGMDMSDDTNGLDMDEDTGPDLPDMEPDLPLDMEPDLPEDMEPDLPEDMEPDLPLDMEPDLPEDMEPDLPEDMEPDLPLDMEPDLPEDMEPDADMPDMPTIPSGLICSMQSAPNPVCNPVDQTGCAAGECKIVFVLGVLDARCAATNSGNLEEGDACNTASPTPECSAELACVSGVCRQICRIHDAYGCDPDGPNPACRNEYSQSGFGTCWPTC